MPISNNIHGEWHDNWNNMVNVNGVWRDAISYVNVNGKWKQMNKLEIEESDIVGFHFIYKLNKEKKSTQFPYLSYNEHIPYNMNLTGTTAGTMDLTDKGVIFTYNHTADNEAGIVEYDGYMYAELTDGNYIDIGYSKEYFGNEDRVTSVSPNISEVWRTYKAHNLDIKFQGYECFSCDGYYISGWNNMFNNMPYLSKADDTEDSDSSFRHLNDYIMMPYESRDQSSFSPIAEIGIARDIHTDYTNMVGSYGYLDHTIYWITVNGVKKPFVFEIYN
jgi:hypothetical protein